MCVCVCVIFMTIRAIFHHVTTMNFCAIFFCCLFENVMDFASASFNLMLNLFYVYIFFFLEKSVPSVPFSFICSFSDSPFNITDIIANEERPHQKNTYSIYCVRLFSLVFFSFHFFLFNCFFFRYDVFFSIRSISLLSDEFLELKKLKLYI